MGISGYPQVMTTDTSTTRDSGLAQRYQDVKARIDQAAKKIGRRGSDVLLVVVTKNADLPTIRQLIDMGHTDFGENRVQNMVTRSAQIQESIDRMESFPEVAGRPAPVAPNWHMIGRLQRNKVRKAIEISRVIHSVDSLRLIEEIQSQAAKLGAVAEVLIEINVSGETTKTGVAPAAVRHVVDQIETMLNVKARGLMCMAPHTDDEEVIRAVFTRCQEVFDEVRSLGSGGDEFNILSMGMSGDFEIAVECGANLVRVGSAIIGDTTSDANIESSD